jgi:Na+-translocating ferredoxin:NAD+ oxidoreductase RnfC subunit
MNKVLVLSGDPLVKDGDSVRKGQKLVTGTILREKPGTQANTFSCSS